MANNDNVELEIRAKALLGEAQQQIAQFLREIENNTKETTKHTSFFGHAMSTAAGTLAGFVSGQAILTGLGQAFSFAKQAVFGMNATLETSTLQFATLMGDSDKARAHVKDLFEIAKKTPFETGPIIEASRMLQTFGGAALNTKANILLLGDASAATGAPINELGTWTGRLYAALQSGKPFGEAAQRLQELAVLSPQARDQLEQMQKSGKSADEIFKTFTNSLGRFNGAMEAQAGTWSGVVSTFTDTINLLVAGTFQPFFEIVRNGLGSINDALGSDAFAEYATAVSSAIRDQVLVAFDLLNRAFGWAKSFASNLGGVWTGLSSTAVGLWKVVALGFDIIVALANKMNLLQGITVVAKVVFDGLAVILSKVGGVLGWVADKVRFMLEAVGLLDKTIAPPAKTLETLGTKTLPTASAAMTTFTVKTEAQRKAEEELAKAREKAFGIDSIKQAELMVKAIGGLPGVAKMGAEQMKQLHELMDNAIDAAKRNGKEVPLSWYRIWEATQKVGDATKGLLETMQKLPDAVNAIPLPHLGEKFRQAVAEIGPSLKDNKASQQIGQSLAQSIGDTFSKNFGPTIMAALTGGGDILKSVGGLFGESFTKHIFGSAEMMKSMTSHFGKALGGMFNSILPGIGALAGPLLAGIGKLFGGLFGVSQAEKDARQERSRFILDIAKQADTLLSAQAKATIAATTYAHEAWDATGKEAAKFNAIVMDAFLATGRGADAARVAIEAITNASHHSATEVKAAEDQINAALEQQKTLNEASAAAEQAKADAAKIAADMQGQLADAVRQKQDLLNAAIERYHFTIDQLGPTMQKQRLSEQAEQLLQDFQLLTQSGISSDVVIKQMGGSINDFVKMALKTGTEIPSAMKPMLEAMAKQGTLTDENGKAITDVTQSGIKFGETLTENFKHVTDKLDELIKALREGLGDQIGAMGTNMETAGGKSALSLATVRAEAEALRAKIAEIPSDKTITVRTVHEDVYVTSSESASPSGGAPSLPGSASGGFYTRPTFRVIAESKPEVVGEPNVIVDAFAKALQGANFGGGSDGRPMVINVQIGSEKLDALVIDATGRALANGQLRVPRRNIVERY